MTGKPIATIPFPEHVRLSRPTTNDQPVTLSAPAMTVLTDFAHTLPVVASPDETIAVAEARMIRRGVRSVLVLDDQDRMVGILTAADLLGEKPLQFSQTHGVKPAEIRVADLMTPISALDALPFEQVSRATVADIVATLQQLGRQHALVVDRQGDEWVVRGIFSSTQIARQLGMELPILVKARTFAEIEAQLK
jgi:CBS domain-containing protein